MHLPGAAGGCSLPRPPVGLITPRWTCPWLVCLGSRLVGSWRPRRVFCSLLGPQHIGKHTVTLTHICWLHHRLNGCVAPGESRWVIQFPSLSKWHFFCWTGFFSVQDHHHAGAGVGQWLYLPGRFGARVTYRLYGGWAFSSSWKSNLFLINKIALHKKIVSGGISSCGKSKTTSVEPKFIVKRSVRSLPSKLKSLQALLYTNTKQNNQWLNTDDVYT